MSNGKYAAYKALDPYFQVVMKGLNGFVDGEHYFDAFADNAVFEFRYNWPGLPKEIRGRDNLMVFFSGYGKSINLHRGDALVVHPSKDGRVITIEYDIQGKILATGALYDNRLISVVTIENRKIIYWRDYLDTLTAWTALRGS